MCYFSRYQNVEGQSHVSPEPPPTTNRSEVSGGTEQQATVPLARNIEYTPATHIISLDKQNFEHEYGEEQDNAYRANDIENFLERYQTRRRVSCRPRDLTT
jgi:hypothetical protein